MSFLLLLLGWIVGISTMGNIFPSTIQSTFSFIAPVVFLLSSIGLLLTFFKTKVSQFFVYRSIFLLLLSLSGFFAGYFYANVQLDQRLAKRVMDIEQVDAIVYISQINQWVLDDPSGAKIRQKAIVLNQANYPVLWTLNIKDDLPNANMLPGHYYQVSGKVRPAHSYAVPGVFDVEKWMLQENVMATLQVKTIQPMTANEVSNIGYIFQQFIGQQASWNARLKLAVEQKRFDFRDYLSRQPFQQKGLLLALLTGDESLLSKETQQMFKRLGISHLLAISGPHVLIFAALFCFVINLLIKHFIPQIYLKIPRPYLMLLPFVLCVWLYTAFVGFEIPALRTLLTVIFISTVILFQQRMRALNILVFSAALLLLFDPFSILSAAFWLSYGACFILIRVYQTIQQKSEPTTEHKQVQTWRNKAILWLKVLIESQWKIFIALFPLVILIFQQVSWAAPFANLIAIPLIGAVIVPLEVVGAFLWLLFEPLGMLFFQLADGCLRVLLWVLGQLDTLMASSLHWFAMTPMQIFMLALAVLMIFLPRGVVPKGWAILCVVPILLGGKQDDAFRLNILDVGQGQAIYLEMPKHNMLIDTGGNYDESKFSVGQQIIIPYLMQQGVKHLDSILLTHLDQDHSGAFSRVAEEIKIDQVFSNQKDQRFDAYPFEYCHAGQTWQYGQVKIEVLSPQSTDLNQVANNQNELSCVLYIQVPQVGKGYKTFLLMGDAGWEAEYQILQRYSHLKVDVLVLGHHGSQHSSSFAFLKQMNPKLAIASAGFGNRYNHPSPITLARLQALKIPLITTIDQGAIQFTLDGNYEMQMREYRAEKKWLIRK